MDHPQMTLWVRFRLASRWAQMGYQKFRMDVSFLEVGLDWSASGGESF